MNDLSIFSEIETCLSPTKEQFNKVYGYPLRPVCVKGVMDTWPAKQNWSFDFFIKYFGDKVISVTKCMNGPGDPETREFSVTEYVDYIKNFQEGEPLYYMSDFATSLLSENLKKEYDTPDYFNCWYDLQKNKKKDLSSFLFLGLASTFTRFHVDIWNTSSWNGLIQGSKIWLFVDPDQGNVIKPTSLNPFDDPYYFNVEFLSAKPLYHIQKPGDLLFIPSRWWHAVYNIENTIAVSGNFMNECNCDHVRGYFEQLGNKKATESINSIIQLNQREDLREVMGI